MPIKVIVGELSGAHFTIQYLIKMYLFCTEPDLLLGFLNWLYPNNKQAKQCLPKVRRNREKREAMRCLKEKVIASKWKTSELIQEKRLEIQTAISRWTKCKLKGRKKRQVKNKKKVAKKSLSITTLIKQSLHSNGYRVVPVQAPERSITQTTTKKRRCTRQIFSFPLKLLFAI